MKNKTYTMFSGICLATALLMSHSMTIHANSGYAGGSGTKEDPYLISTPEHLNQLQIDVNVNGINNQLVCYELTNDIDLMNFDSDDDPNNGNWTPIRGYGFKGKFNGNGYTIKNVKINLPEEESVGFFGGSIYAYIDNVNFESVSIRGKKDVGVLIGHGNYTHINRVSVTDAEVVGEDRVGGLIGAAYNVYATEVAASSNVTGKTSVGGVMGYANLGSLIDSYSIGTVKGEDKVGGILGEDYDNKNERLYASGQVFGTSKVGAIAGSQTGRNVNLKDSYWDKTNLLGLDPVGSSDHGVEATTSNLVGLNLDEMIGEKAKNYMTVFDFEAVWESQKNKTPILKWQVKNESPVIIAEDIEILEGDDFEASDYATAMDPEDGPLPVIVVRDEVNPKLPGNYEVEYAVTDSKGLTTTKTIRVTVKKRLVSLNNIPTIQAKDLTIKEGQKINLLDYVTATDLEDGPLVVELVTDNLNVNVPGQYTATFRTIDTQGAIATKTIQITVLKRIVPVIKAEDVYLKQGDSFNALDHVTATDEKDSNLTIKVIENTVETSKVGIYRVTYQVINSEGEKATKTIRVFVEAKETILPDFEDNLMSDEEGAQSDNNQNQTVIKEPVETGLSGIETLMIGVLFSGVGILNEIRRTRKTKQN